MAGIPLIAVWFFVLLSIRGTAVDEGLEQIRVQAKSSAARMQEPFDAIASDVRILAASPEVRAFARAHATGGLDPNTGDSYQEIRARFSETRLNLSNSKPHYVHLSVLDTAGDELVRVEFDGTSASTIPVDDLVNRSADEFFREASRAKRGATVRVLFGARNRRHRPAQSAAADVRGAGNRRRRRRSRRDFRS